MKKSVLFAAIALSALSACASVGTRPDSSTVAKRYGTWGFDPAGMDRSVKPGDDFYRYADGKALDALVIPPDRTNYGSFNILRILSDTRVHVILEDAAAHPDAGQGNRSRFGTYYRAYMDEAGIEARGSAPLEADLAKVRAADSHEKIAALMGASHVGFGASVFGAFPTPDAKDPGHYSISMGSGGLGLPDKDYYLKPSFAETKVKYQAYVEQMLTLAGWPEPQARAADILAFETKMAEASWERAERRNRDKTYNPVAVADLAAFAPGFDWKAMLVAADLAGVQQVVLTDNTAFPKKAAIFAATPVSTLQAWAAFNTTDQAAPYLPTRFVQARYAFRDKVLSGQPELAVRWKRAVSGVNDALGEAVGQDYVAHYFTPAAKAQMLELVGNIKVALAARIDRLDWMSPETKVQAQDKLAHFTVKIAYPDKWRDYSGLQVMDGDLYGNVERSSAFEWAYRVGRLNGPVDRSEWGMTPQTVNAYYNSSLNEIVFPAAILQPPFFDPDADPAVNYGAIGGVIGHEISHGFDDQGRKSDGMGRLRDWWTAEDGKKFDAKAERLGAQYSAFEPLPGEHINGKLTMGENIGDMGGINLGLEAWHASLKGKPAPVVDGFTGDQRVFLGWAQVWIGKRRKEALIQQLHTDPHSPEQARVNAVVRNVDAWYAAFDVKPGDKLYVAPADRVHIW